MLRFMCGLVGAAATLIPISLSEAQVAPAADKPQEVRAASVATRVTPPKRRPDEAVGAFSEPSVSGEWLVVRSGVPTQDLPGALHIYRRTAQAWAHFQTLLSPDMRPIDDGFGFSTAIDTNTLIIGAPDYEVEGVRSGAVLVYRFDGQQWSLGATVVSPDPIANGYFGQNVALAQGTLVAGEARNATTGGWAPNRAVYIFRENEGNWALQATLEVPTDLAAMTFSEGSHGFGNYVDVDRDTIAVSARDRVYLYTREAATWTMQQRLDAPTDPNDSAVGTGFARSLDLEGDVLVVAALRAAGTVPDAGAAFVYRRSAGQWRQEAKLMALDGATRDMFGHWVAQSGGTIVSAAFRHAVGGQPQVGAAYVYRQVGGEWTQIDKVVPSDPVNQLFTGYAVALDGDTVVMTAGATPDPQTADYLWTYELQRTGP